MRIERTHDMEIVREIIGHPMIWPHIHEDGIDEPNPMDDEALHWMLISDPEPAGVFLIHGRGSHCMEIHTCLLPRIWGEASMKAAGLLLKHVFCDLGQEKAVTNVPSYNRRALRFAVANGMQIEGTNRASFMRNGVMIDQIMLGITKREWTSCQQQQW